MMFKLLPAEKELLERLKELPPLAESYWCPGLLANMTKDRAWRLLAIATTAPGEKAVWEGLAKRLRSQLKRQGMLGGKQR